ncbi:MAG: GerMN domain-containing protein [Dehalobacterium sp.]
MKLFKSRHNTYGIGFVLLLVLLVSATAGCALLDRLQAWKNGEEEAPVSEVPEGLEGTEILDQALIGETKEIVLYFSDESGQYLVSEMRDVPKVEGIARATIQELIAGPSVESGLLPTIPVGTQLLDINVRPDGLCIVDLSGELVLNHPGGSMNEEMTVYSVVNTLTQFPSVKEVQILVDGEQVETIAGHMDVSTTMARNEEMIMVK